MSNREFIITGNVAQFNFYVTWQNSNRKNQEDENGMFFFAQKYSGEIQLSIEEIVKNTLGEQFEITKFNIRKGSVEIILTIGTIYYAISKYKNFVDSLKLFKSQIDSLLKRRFNDQINFVNVNSNLSLGAGLTNAKKMTVFTEGSRGNNFVIYYLILSHFILTGVIIYLLIK